MLGEPYSEMIDFLQPRDHELRLAHLRAFAKISQAGLAEDYQAAVSGALQELVDACEAYTHSR